MYLQCCVPGCTSLRQDATLHKFPECEKRLKKWLEFLPCDSVRNKTLSDFAHMRICHKHFEARFVTPKSRLLMTAYPTLFLESEINSGTPLNFSSANSENVNAFADHQYAKKRHHDHRYSKSAVSESHPPILPTNTEVQPSTSKMSEVDLPHPDLQQVKESCQDKQPSTSKLMSTDLTIPDVHQIKESCPVDEQPSTSKAKDVTPEHTLSSDTGIKKVRRLKVVETVGSLTPKCRQIYNEYRKSRKLLSFTRRAKKALRFSKENSFEQMTQRMNPLARSIFAMQVKMCTKQPKGRRFNMDEKLIALSILKQGPKSYRFLQKIFILPSESTEREKLVAKLNVTAGINPQIFNAIKDEVKTWKEEKKYCSIIFDEMALQTGLTYTPQDEICGFVDTTEKKKKYADHALVFLIKGVVYKWQQPIAYYLCEGSTSALEIKKILQNIVTAVGETGLIPVTVISDQGASFRSAIRSLQEETRAAQLRENKNPDDTIHINGFDMFVIFDPPHLIKGIRNNFLTKDIKYLNNICSWTDIVDVYKTDCEHAETRLLHKLNDEHVIVEKIKKMKVKNCVRVFSKTMAGALNYTSAFSHYSDGRPVSSTLKNTAKVVSFLDDLFDSVNGSAVFNKKRRGKDLRVAVTEKSRHHAFWPEAISKLHDIKFIDKNGHESIPPSVKNWISTIRSFMKLWQFLTKKNIKIMRPRFLNSDAIENFFGQVRSYNFRDNNPTCHNFTNTFKSLLITGFIKFHRSSFNCEDDASAQLVKIKSLFVGHPKEVNESSGETDESSMDTYPVIQDAKRERLKIQSRAFTAGWVVRKILIKVKCNVCKKDLTTKDNTEVHKWIFHREYKNMSKRKLTYPAEAIVRYFGTVFENTINFLEKNAHCRTIGHKIKCEIINKYSFDHITCQKHRTEVIDALLSMTIKLCIHNWCNVINKILNGQDILRLQQRQLPEMQNNALLKFTKKLKKKNK